MGKGKVIVGYDGRDVSDDALALGRMLAQAYGDELIVASTYGFEQHPDPDASGDYFERRAAYFDATFAKAAERSGTLPFRAEAIDDLPGRGLYMLAEAEDARIVVVGSTTRGRIGQALIGSTGELLLSSAPCAVAVAPRGYSHGERPALGLVGVAFDGHDDSVRAVEEAHRLAKLMDADLRVISVGPILRWPVSPRGPIWFSEEEIGARMREVLGDIEGDRVRLLLEQGEPAEVLAAVGVELDLLVAGSRGFGPVRRAVLGSTTRELLRLSPCPVLIVPRGEDAVEPEPGSHPAERAEAAS